MTAEIVPLGHRAESLEQHVAAELRAAMARANVSQTQLATALHISRGEISKLLSGSRPIKVQFIEQACAALALDPAALFGFSGPRPRTPPPPPGGGGQLPHLDSNQKPFGKQSLIRGFESIHRGRRLQIDRRRPVAA